MLFLRPPHNTTTTLNTRTEVSPLKGFIYIFTTNQLLGCFDTLALRPQSPNLQCQKNDYLCKNLNKLYVSN